MRSIVVTTLLVLTLSFSAHAQEEDATPYQLIIRLYPRIAAPPIPPQIYLPGALRHNFAGRFAEEFARALALPFVTVDFAADHMDFGNRIIFQDEFDREFGDAAFDNRLGEPVARDLYAPADDLYAPADDLYPTEEELEWDRARGLTGHVGALMLNHFFLHLG